MAIITNIDKLKINDIDEDLEFNNVLTIDKNGLVLKGKRERDGILIYNISKGCYVIQSNDGKVYMVDAGEEYMGYDAVDFIENVLGKEKVEKIFITHYHFNHVGGVAPVINSMTVKSVHSNGTYSEDPREPYATLDPIARTAMLDAISSNNVTYTYNELGDSFIEGDLKFTFWSPLPQYATQGGYTEDPNGLSGAMIRMDFGDFSILFGGDINRRDEVLEVFSEQNNLETTAFAWPHHGDPNTAKDEIINPMNLKFAFIEDLSRSASVVGYLEAKGIDYGWLIGNEYTGIKAFNDSSYEKIVKEDLEYDVLELSCENQTELELGIVTYDNSGWIVDYGDGVKETGLSSDRNSYNLKHTYSEPFTGNVKILMKKGGLKQIKEIRSFANSFTFDISVLPNSIRVLNFQTSTQQAITGEFKDFPRDLEFAHFTGVNNISGDIGNAPPNLDYIYIRGSGDKSGLIDNAPRSLKYLRLGGNTSIGGDIGNAPPNLETLYMLYQNIGGLIDNAPRSLRYLRLLENNSVSGDLGKSPDDVTYLQVLYGPPMQFYSRKTWSDDMQRIAVDTDFTALELDNLLIDLSETSWRSGGEVSIKVTIDRTSASDQAVSDLSAKGVDVIFRY